MAHQSATGRPVPGSCAESVTMRGGLSFDKVGRAMVTMLEELYGK
jgi:hypothetical protein